MTKIEAIMLLKNIIQVSNNSDECNHVGVDAFHQEALEMAIKALNVASDEKVSGKHFDLPVPIGGTVYGLHLTHWDDEIREYVVESATVSKYGIVLKAWNEESELYATIYPDYWGKTAFATRSEAEAVLEKLEEVKYGKM